MLLDTHVVVHWYQVKQPHVTPQASAAISDPRSEVYVSAASVWEIEIKRKLGKLRAPSDVLAAIAGSSMALIPITGEHGVAAGRLPLHHNDPFDRMLVAQASVEGLTLLTADERLRVYDVRIMSAGT